ncbi:MAG: GRP family sugar transporter [Bacillales bacterium]|nr:GRP family sugar transporter [Bacillales bacterium]
MEWIIVALLAALFTSLTTILSKIGIKDVNSNFATGYRTLIVVFCSLIICLIKGSLSSFPSLNTFNWIFLILSGIVTGLSWLCYYKALKLGDVNKVVPIDKSSFILSSILFVIFFFDDTTNSGDPLTISMLVVSIILIGLGTFLMIEKKQGGQEISKTWLLYAILSSVFAALVSFFIKLGLKNIDSSLGTLIRTIIVFIFASAIVLIKKDYKDVTRISPKSWIFLTLSGLSTGGVWLCEYEALNMVNSNPIAVNSIGKFSILLTMLFSLIILKEKFTKKAIFGLVLLLLGITVITIFSL